MRMLPVVALIAAPALRLLEYAFLALLYLFLLRVVRAVWVELKEPAPAPQGPGEVLPASSDGNVGKAGVVVSQRGEGKAGGMAVLGEELTIGRAPGCGLVLGADNFVSAHHARVFRRGQEYWVEDLGSTNGTLLNERRISAAAPLRRGDRLQVGRTLLELQR
jgi:hypothetical protein